MVTARPRAWTTTTPDDPVEWVRVVEWDREKVEAAITRALTDLLDRKPDSTAYGMARAIFDALDREQT